MLSESILDIIRAEMRRHHFDTFVDDPPSIAQGGRGCVVSGCPTCKARFGTTTQFIEHLIQCVEQAIRNAECEPCESKESVRCAEIGRDSL